MAIPALGRPEGVPLDQWEEANPPYSQQIGYRDGFWLQTAFVRNHLHGIFVPAEQQVENPVLVVGVHSEKSSVLPVYCIAVPGLVLRFAIPALSWVGWHVSVLAEHDIAGLPSQPTDMWSPVPEYTEGLYAFRPVMGDEYTYEDPSVNRHRFSCVVGHTDWMRADDTKMIAFCRILKASLNRD